MDRRLNRHERILRRRAEMERKRRLRLQLHETQYEGSSESSDASHHSSVYEEEVLSLEESDADVDMQRQEQFEQEQMKNDSQSKDISGDDNNTDTQFSFPPSINNPDKESSCLSQNSSHLLVQTITSGASFKGRFSSPNSVADQNKTHSIFDKVDEEKTKLQEEPRYFCKDKGDFECKHCDRDIKLSSTVLLEISKKLDSVLINQAIIVRSVNPDHAKSIIPCNFPPIPLKTKKDFQKMETFLAANRINYEAIVCPT